MITPSQESRMFDKAEVAELTMSEISGMTDEQLTQVIRAVSPPFVRRDVKNRLSYLDREPLERLVYLVRRCCRNQGY